MRETDALKNGIKVLLDYLEHSDLKRKEFNLEYL
jgi:hypothetical protein